MESSSSECWIGWTLESSGGGLSVEEDEEKEEKKIKKQTGVEKTQGTNLNMVLVPLSFHIRRESAFSLLCYFCNREKEKSNTCTSTKYHHRNNNNNIAHTKKTRSQHYYVI